MGFTIDTYTLNVLSFSETSSPKATEWDAWENEAWTVKRTVYGVKRVWRLECVEENVAWSSSAAKYLAEKAKTGETVSFSVDEGSRFQLSQTNVYVLDIEFRMPLSGQKNVRYFTVTLREV